MSPFAGCPIVELRPGVAPGDVVAQAPLVEYGSTGWCAVAETLAACLTHRPTFPVFDPRQSAEDVAGLIADASQLVRTDRTYRGRVCTVCGHPT